MGSVDKVLSAVRNGLLAGTWKAGAPLPSARELSERLRVNKNTVSKAYGVLTREGLVDVSPGRRARAAPRARRARSAEDVVRGELRRALEPVLRSAQMLGLGPERVIAAANEELGAFYRTTAARVTLVECNRVDAQQYAGELSALLGISVSFALLASLGSARGADVFAVPYYHLDDVAESLRGARVAGVHIAPDPAALLDVLQSSQRLGAKVGLLCGNAGSAKRFARLLEFYTAKAIEIAHFRDPRAARRLMRRCTRLFVTPEALAALPSLSRRKGVVVFNERIDPESLGPLREILQTLGGEARGGRAGTLAAAGA